jgi:polyphosphate kinase
VNRPSNSAVGHEPQAASGTADADGSCIGKGTARFRHRPMKPLDDADIIARADRFHPRELSWLAFNRRVLEEAQDSNKPLLERLKFLAIVSSNLDEFVMVRVAELHAVAHGRADDPDTGDRQQATQLLDRVREKLRRQMDDQYRCWRDEVEPRLEQIGCCVVPPEEWTELDQETVRLWYRDRVEPVLTPLAVDPTRPFPLVANKGLNVAVTVEPEDGGERDNALVAVPSGSRLVALVGAPGRYALLEDIILTRLDTLFPGYRIHSRCLFRVTRDGALDIDEDQAEDLLSEIEQELASREHSHAVRLEVAAGGDADLHHWLTEAMDLDLADVVPVNGPLDLTMLFGLMGKVERPDLCDPPLDAVMHPSADVWEEPFACIRAGELLLHHPFQSFQRVVELVERAAADPQVLAIKQTLYRVSGDSPIVRALARAARAGKQVTVLIELKARFDEAANIRWARELEEAGAHVVYGLVGLKVHGKLLLIIRREEDGIRRYCHLGTGNYNDRTARLYTDLSYLTANEAVGRDVSALFNMLTGYSQPPEWERLAVSPLSMRRWFTEHIRTEADNARAGREARIVAKFNSLVDHAIVDELYAASRAGVEIDLIVRGMCILRPGVPGLSERIRVRSIVGRLLEHSRIYYFRNHLHAASEPVVAIASADWMTRNLDRRVEALVRIESEALRDRLARILEICLEDDSQARLLLPDGTYVRCRPAAGEKTKDAFARLLKEAHAKPSSGDQDDDDLGLMFVPRSKRE